MYKQFQLWFIITEKSQYFKIMKNHEMIIIGEKVIFCSLKKTMMPIESPCDFFTEGLNVVRPSIVENFRLTVDIFV